MYKLLKKKQGKGGGAKRGRAHTQKLVPGLGRVFRRNLALLRKRVKFVNPARAREKKEKNHAPLPRLAERPQVRKFVAPATDAEEQKRTAARVVSDCCASETWSCQIPPRDDPRR